MSDSGILTAISQNIGNIIILTSLKYINTGDRTLDNALTAIAGAIASYLMNKIISFLQKEFEQMLKANGGRYYIVRTLDSFVNLINEIVKNG